MSVPKELDKQMTSREFDALSANEVHKEEVMRKYVIDEMSKFKDFNEVRKFAKALSADQTSRLAEWLSTWRRNRIHDTILRGPDKWFVEYVDISSIKVTRVNEGVNSLLEKHAWRLESLLSDAAICQHAEFKDQSVIHSRSLIAVKEGKDFFILDGIHRAVRLACDGCRRFELVYFER